jgi:predicted nucleic acid-binding Zn ribbon protein
MESPRGSRRDEPHHVGDVLSHLFTLRGYGRTRSDRQLTEIWQNVAGENIATRTRVQCIRGGVLQVGVSNSAMLQELDGFHRWSLLETLQREHPHLGITGIRFRLSSRSGA